MTMKSTFNLFHPIQTFRPLVLIFSFFMSTSLVSALEIREYYWKMNDTYRGERTDMVPDERATADLILFGNAKLSDDGRGQSGQAGDRSLLLDGQVRTQAHFHVPEDIAGMRLHLWAYSDKQPTGDQHYFLATLTKVMRLTLNRDGDLVFAVWDEERHPSVVKLPFPSDGKWREIEAVYQNGVHALRVNERIESISVDQTERLFENERGMFFWGANINNDNWHGAIDDVQLELEIAP